MSGTKLARIRRCHRCAHRITHHADVARWPFCIFRGYENRIELNDSYMEGPDENCPAGFWKDLPAVDLDAERQQARKRAIESEVRRLGPIVEALAETMTIAELIHRLEGIVAIGLMRAESATEIVLNVERRRGEAR